MLTRAAAPAARHLLAPIFCFPAGALVATRAPSRPHPSSPSPSPTTHILLPGPAWTARPGSACPCAPPAASAYAAPIPRPCPLHKRRVRAVCPPPHRGRPTAHTPTRPPPCHPQSTPPPPFPGSVALHPNPFDDGTPPCVKTSKKLTVGEKRVGEQADKDRQNTVGESALAGYGGGASSCCAQPAAGAGRGEPSQRPGC